MIIYRPVEIPNEAIKRRKLFEKLEDEEIAIQRNGREYESGRLKYDKKTRKFYLKNCSKKFLNLEQITELFVRRS